jgi:hypothetical protein
MGSYWSRPCCCCCRSSTSPTCISSRCHWTSTRRSARALAGDRSHAISNPTIKIEGGLGRGDAKYNKVSSMLASGSGLTAGRRRRNSARSERTGVATSSRWRRDGARRSEDVAGRASGRALPRCRPPLRTGRLVIGRAVEDWRGRRGHEGSRGLGVAVAAVVALPAWRVRD